MGLSLKYGLSLLIIPSLPRIGVSVVIVVSVCSFEIRRSSRKFSRMARLMVGCLVSKMGAFHSNHAVNFFSQVSASVMDMSLNRGPFGFSVLSRRSGLENCGSGYRVCAWGGFFALSPGCP